MAGRSIPTPGADTWDKVVRTIYTTGAAQSVVRRQLIAGIDPGLDGAIAFLDRDGELVGVEDTPTFTMAGRRREYDVAAMARLLIDRPISCVFIERQGPRPGASVISTFKLGYGYGLWIGLAAALGIPQEIVSPQVWQRSMYAGAVGAAGKDRSLLVATRLFPQADLRHRADRADALLIAEWGRRALIGKEDRWDELT